MRGLDGHHRRCDCGLCTYAVIRMQWFEKGKLIDKQAGPLGWFW